MTAFLSLLSLPTLLCLCLFLNTHFFLNCPYLFWYYTLLVSIFLFTIFFIPFSLHCYPWSVYIWVLQPSLHSLSFCLGVFSYFRTCPLTSVLMLLTFSGLQIPVFSDCSPHNHTNSPLSPATFNIMMLNTFIIPFGI